MENGGVLLLQRYFQTEHKFSAKLSQWNWRMRLDVKTKSPVLNLGSITSSLKMLLRN